MPPSLAHLSKELGLSEDQQRRLRTIHEDHRGRMEARKEAFHTAQKALMDVVLGDGAGDLNALNAAFAARHLDMVVEMASIHTESSAVLTPAQREQAKAIHAPHLTQGPRAEADHAGPPERRH